MVRRNHGGEWCVQDNVPGVDGPVIAFKVREGETYFLPAKAYRRLRNGAEDNVLFMFQLMTGKAKRILSGGVT